jgi:heme O synthase-like polyprenyltransferase
MEDRNCRVSPLMTWCLMAFIDSEYKSFISDVEPILSVRSKSKDSIVVIKVFSLLLCLCCVEQGRTEWLGVDNLKEYGGYRNQDLVMVSFLISWFCLSLNSLTIFFLENAFIVYIWMVQGSPVNIIVGSHVRGQRILRMNGSMVK